MRKAILILISGCLFISGAAFAAEAPISGTSRLKLEDDSVRTARKQIEQIDKQIAKLDLEIAQSQGLAATYKALPNDGLRSYQMHALATSSDLERGELLKERAALAETLQQ